MSHSNVSVIYHNPCFDGLGAALAATLFFEDEEFDLVPLNHGEPIPYDLLKGKDLLIFDFSFKKDIIEHLHKNVVASIEIHDHHLSAQKDLEHFDFAYFDMNHSGAYLAWKRFFPNEPVPELILYLEDRDLWKFKLPSSKEINAAINSYGSTDVEALKSLYENWDQETLSLLAQGKGILRNNDAMVKIITETSEVVSLGKHVVGVANASILFSEVPSMLLAQNPLIDYAIGYYWHGKKQAYCLSFRSRGDVDVSQIAKLYGGGGHKQSSGAIVKELPWKGRDSKRGNDETMRVV